MMLNMTDRERVKMILTSVAYLRQQRLADADESNSIGNEDRDHEATEASLLPIESVAEDLVEWLVQTEPSAVSAFLRTHVATLLDHRAIAFVTLLLREECDEATHRELAARRDLLLRARRIGVEAALREMNYGDA